MKHYIKRGIFADTYVETCYSKGSYYNETKKETSRFLTYAMGIAISAIAVIGTIAIIL